MLQQDTEAIIALYQAWLDAWNARNAAGMADLFAEDGNLIGFDGSQLNGRPELHVTLDNIFKHHQTAAYVAIIREIRLLSPGVAWLKAEVGMVPAGKNDINPALNAIQTVIAMKGEDGNWQISLFQNTPAALHGQPELLEQMNVELRKVLFGTDQLDETEINLN
jgi:uncharacterized protein (TIGR02246 family)